MPGRKLSIVIGYLLVTIAPCSLAKENPVPEALTCTVEETNEQLTPGIRLRHFCYGIRGHAVVHLAEMDLSRPELHFLTTAPGTVEGFEFSAAKTSRFAEENDAVLAINASFFAPFDSGTHGKPPYPKIGDGVNALGLHIHNGEWISDNSIDIPRFRLRVDGAFCANWHSVFIVEGVCPTGTQQGIGAGPILLKDGRHRTFAKFDARFAIKRAPRSVVAYNHDRSKLWFIVVDGRQPGYSQGMNLPELVDLLTHLGASDAIHFDGGGSAVMVGPKGRLLSRPIQQRKPGNERVVANHLGVQWRDTKD